MWILRMGVSMLNLMDANCIHKNLTTLIGSIWFVMVINGFILAFSKIDCCQTKLSVL